MSGLLFYDPSSNTGEFYAVNVLGEIGLLRTHTDWRSSWTHIVPGNFSGGDDLTDLLLYDPTAGEGEFYKTDGSGGIALIRKQTGWRSSWTHIIAGAFGGSAGSTDLLFYDRAAGGGQFYAVEQGRISEIALHTNWRPSWTHIVPGSFGGDSVTDLLFYEADTGTGEFYACDGRGGITLMRTHTGWRQTWTHIIPGSFGGNTRTDLLFYDANAGEGEFWATDGQGGIALLQSYTGRVAPGGQIVEGNFDGNGFSDLLVYDPAAGTGRFEATAGGSVRVLKDHTGWRKSWTRIVSGHFGGSVPSFVPAPTGLAVTSVVDRAVSLKWNHVGGSNLSGFTITFKGTRSGLPDHEGTKAASSGVRSATVTGLRSGFTYTFSVTTRNPAGISARSNQVTATLPARTLVVSKTGTGNSAVFTIKGAGFTPHSLVTLKITAPHLAQVQFPETARPDGTFESPHAVPCTSGLTLTFKAFENSDPEGTFALPVVSTCP
jgi:hypothetical protein